MADNNETYCIGFFKYVDSNIWNKTGMRKKIDENELKEDMKKIPYIDEKSINIRSFDLPIKININKDYE